METCTGYVKYSDTSIPTESNHSTGITQITCIAADVKNGAIVSLMNGLKNGVMG